MCFYITLPSIVRNWAVSAGVFSRGAVLVLPGPASGPGGVLRDPDPRPDLRQLRPWGPLRGSPAGLRLPWKAAGLPGYQRGPWGSAAGSGSASGSPAAASGECCRRISGSCGPGGRCGALSAGRAPAGLRLPWKAAGLPGYQRGPWGECCGIRIRVRGCGSCFGECCRRISGSCGPGGRCRGSGCPGRLRAFLGISVGPG